jgi:hypothetical protein
MVSITPNVSNKRIGDVDDQQEECRRRQQWEGHVQNRRMPERQSISGASLDRRGMDCRPGQEEDEVDRNLFPD